MGGDSSFVWISSTEDDSSPGVDYLHELNISPYSSGDAEGLSSKLEKGEKSSRGVGYQNESNTSPVSRVNKESELSLGKVLGVGPRMSSISEVAERRKCKVYAEVLKSYEKVNSRIERLKEAKSRILSYTPGSWVEKALDMDLDEYDVPETTALLLTGPKASGKSSLVNKISQVLEDGVFASSRAQVSNNQLTEDGTYFVHQYTIPRGSGSFCLYDTRGLSEDSCENLKMLKRWRTKGVRHGELVKRESDSTDLKARLKCKAQGLRSSSHRRMVNFVIFVVDGISVLEDIDGDTVMKRQYCQQIAASFNNPLLSFRDDKPVVVVTHGDIISVSERVRIRVYLGELLGIPPTRQIFDIPESDDPATVLTLVDMLSYCLEHADGNLPVKKRVADRNLPVTTWSETKVGVKTSASFFLTLLLVLMVLVVAAVFQNHGFHYSHDPIRPTNASQNHCVPHTPTNISQSHAVQACRCDSLTNASENLGVLDSRSNAPTNKSQRNGVQSSYPCASTDKSKKDGAQASQPHGPTNKPQKNAVQQPHEPDNTAEKTVEWHKIRHLWYGSDDDSNKHDVYARPPLEPVSTEDIQVEWHKIRHLWYGLDD